MGQTHVSDVAQAKIVIVHIDIATKNSGRVIIALIDCMATATSFLGTDLPKAGEFLLIFIRAAGQLARVGFFTGNPQVLFSNPYLYLPIPVPAPMGTGFTVPSSSFLHHSPFPMASHLQPSPLPLQHMLSTTANILYIKFFINSYLSPCTSHAWIMMWQQQPRCRQNTWHCRGL
jgi:hypothetical protein